MRAKIHILLLSFLALISAQPTTKWQTLSGKAPLVIARGGFSGIYPDSSYLAYQWAVMSGPPNLQLWCDVQLTKDGVGICFPNIRLNNASNIAKLYKKRQKTYTVNGVPREGWFSVDFTKSELTPVNLTQSIPSRMDSLDANLRMPILSVEDVPVFTKPAGLWLNIPYDAFFSQHNLSMTSFIISLSRRMVISYTSSPEVGFLKGIVSHFRTRPTKLIFQFLGRDDVEPSTSQTYSSLIKNLTFVKTFAAGILVPKDYIWLVDNSLYLRSYTSLVVDAHKEGLEVFAYTFADDASLPYNYSYDPVAECLSFIDNGQFSIDGMLSDFPTTPSAAIDCFSHMGQNDTLQGKRCLKYKVRPPYMTAPPFLSSLPPAEPPNPILTKHHAKRRLSTYAKMTLVWLFLIVLVVVLFFIRYYLPLVLQLFFRVWTILLAQVEHRV